ncbi:unnamed protein product [Schistosoma curassoni]|uniref:Paramyosin n=1 Tax=Schistosoma curassoni TaxID=6186 RepID=A0A183JU34_9TREM|nr:unnamed protein product [Schistosoma curassoni]
MEENLAREQKIRGDVEKSKRKLEGDLKATQETVDDLERVKRDLEEQLRRKEAEISGLSGKFEDEQGLVAQLQRKIKELQTRIQELEEDLEAERAARSKAEKSRQQVSKILQFKLQTYIQNKRMLTMEKMNYVLFNSVDQMLNSFLLYLPNGKMGIFTILIR